MAIRAGDTECETLERYTFRGTHTHRVDIGILDWDRRLRVELHTRATFSPASIRPVMQFQQKAKPATTSMTSSYRYVDP